MSFPRNITNFDELTDNLKKGVLKLIDDELRDKYMLFGAPNIELLLKNIEELMPTVEYEGLKKKIDTFVQGIIKGTQQVVGSLLDIPPIVQENKTVFKFDKNICLTGVHFNQTGWKKEDRWDLEINKNKIVDNTTTKEIGEHKCFNTYFKVDASVPISFILHNNSGNSRQIIIDLEYIEF